MANREQRGNREKRKPKADKKNATASTSPFSSAVARQKAEQGQSGKKGR